MATCCRRLLVSIRRYPSNPRHSFDFADKVYISNTPNTYFSLFTSTTACHFQFTTCASVSTPYGFPRLSYGFSCLEECCHRKHRIPEGTSNFVGTRLELHNRVQRSWFRRKLDILLMMLFDGGHNMVYSFIEKKIMNMINKLLFNQSTIHDLYLLNPLSGRHINLPVFHTLPCYPITNCVFKRVIISCSPEEECRALIMAGLYNNKHRFCAFNDYNNKHKRFFHSRITDFTAARPPPDGRPIPEMGHILGLECTNVYVHNFVQSLIHAGDLDNASYVVRQSVINFECPTSCTCNAVIQAMYRAKRYDDAKDLFHYFFRQYRFRPDIISFNFLIVTMCESDGIDEALKVYEYILGNAPYTPSAVTYRHLTKGLVDAGRISDAVGLLREMSHKGHDADSLVYNNVILGLLNLGNLDKANELFEELKECCTFSDGVVNATFMDWFFNHGKPKEAMEYYKDLRRRSNYRMVPETLNVALETLLRHGKKKEARDLFNDKLDDHFAFNSQTFNIMVNECFKEGNVEGAMEVFQRSGKTAGLEHFRSEPFGLEPFEMDVGGFNNMIMRLCELEMMDEAEQYYNLLISNESLKSLDRLEYPLQDDLYYKQLISPDINTYTTLIDAYVKLDRVDGMIDKYRKMVEAGMRVNPRNADRWFGYMIGKGKAGSDCLPILLTMAADKNDLKPEDTTFGIVIRGLVEEGDFDATAKLLKVMTNQGIEASPSLKEYVLGVFDGQGRRPEAEYILSCCPTLFKPFFFSNNKVNILNHCCDLVGDSYFKLQKFGL